MQGFYGCAQQINKVDACDNLTDKVAYLKCRKQKVKHNDLILNNKIKELKKKFGPLDKDNIAAAQEAWEVYRDKQCSCYSSLLKGNQSIINYYDCMLQLTLARLHQIAELEDIE